MTKSIILTLILLLITFVTIRFANFFIKKMGEKKEVVTKRIYYVTKFAHFVIYFIALIALAIVWNVEFGGISILASSIFAVIGVALFAQWSILSNLTSSIIIFFTFPARVGDTIKIMDGDNSIQGEIIEISLFHIEILDEKNNKILYPNNLFIQKPIMNIAKNKKKKPPKYI